MSKELAYKYELALSNFDLSQLPVENRIPGTAEFREAVSRCVQKQWQKLGGKTQIIVDDDKVTVIWTTTQVPDLLSTAISYLQEKDYSTGITILEFALSREPSNVDILYNLGMALSDRNELDRAIELLQTVVEIEPNFENARVALGVAYSRNGNNEKAIQILKQAVEIDSDNPWARRNYGGCLLKQGEYKQAKIHFEKAVDLIPGDQASWFGLAQTYEAIDELDKADNAYKKVVDLDEYSSIAEMARDRRSAIAKIVYDKKTIGQARPDAVFYCVAALEKYQKMTKDQIQGISFEIAMLGRGGFDVNEPTPKYKLKTLEGVFSGLQLVCYMYVGFQIINPDLDVGFDLKKEYQQAKILFNG